ncbi:hypothetical protein BH18ACT1_BH18ACT1_17270 [soil metagenome]
MSTNDTDLTDTTDGAPAPASNGAAPDADVADADVPDADVPDAAATAAELVSA